MQHELAVLQYPIFVHLYLELVTAGHSDFGEMDPILMIYYYYFYWYMYMYLLLVHVHVCYERLIVTGISFFMKYHSKQETFYNEELTRLRSITSPEQIINNDLVEMYR